MNSGSNIAETNCELKSEVPGRNFWERFEISESRYFFGDIFANPELLEELNRLLSDLTFKILPPLKLETNIDNDDCIDYILVSNELEPPRVTKLQIFSVHIYRRISMKSIESCNMSKK